MCVHTNPLIRGRYGSNNTCISRKDATPSSCLVKRCCALKVPLCWTMNSLSHISSYFLLRLNRNRHGGWILLYIREYLSYNVTLCLAVLWATWNITESVADVLQPVTSNAAALYYPEIQPLSLPWWQWNSLLCNTSWKPNFEHGWRSQTHLTYTYVKRFAW